MFITVSVFTVFCIMFHRSSWLGFHTKWSHDLEPLWLCLSVDVGVERIVDGEHGPQPGHGLHRDAGHRDYLKWNIVNWSFTFRGVIISLPCLLWDMHRTIGTGSQSERRRWWRRRWWSPVQWRTRGRSRCWRRWRGWTDWWRTAWRRSRWWTRLWLVLCSAPSVPQPVKVKRDGRVG